MVVQSRPTSRFLHDRRGSSAVEFALVFPLLAALMLGVVAISKVFYTMSSVQWAIERSVRQLMLDQTTTSTELEVAVNELLGNIGGVEISIAYSQTAPPSDDGSDTIPVAHVVTDVSYPISLPFVPVFTAEFQVETYVPRPF